ncbi:cobyrinate a,c-diamide synthase [Desulfitobacterium sp.]|uniref:cobyrinate a,c-diamide synthase n=1 Tax=Desulfitobacterium sp. TaxID=49981 RepID=UPI002B20AEBF|nr:cobyrinate a,c-diamide synthase [Desulfitobacterium sp.]MEA4901729.1 cobyrinate a,c-diamide synthase [Desulfitobacterium sp.]
MNIPRVVIAGTHSGVGKTTLATGIMSVLTHRKRPVQGYKIGPDYIDPSFHALATGRPSRNLDRWLLGEHLVSLFAGTAAGQWAVVEGVMGLFDGMSGTPGFGSTADVAKQLKAPVILVVDAINMSRSVAALVHGFCTFDPGVNIQGIILNRVKSKAQETLLKEALAEIQIPVLGAVPKEESLKLPERHLGLVPSQERKYQDSFWEDLERVITTYIDLERLEQIMQRAEDFPDLSDFPDFPDFPDLSADSAEIQGLTGEKGSTETGSRSGGLRLGVARDEAFTFYYEDALEEIQRSGFQLIPFSPLHDSELPKDLDAVFLGGGFPELHLEGLSQNRSFLHSLNLFAQSGKGIYAECGGYIYLGQAITDFEGRRFPMASLIPLEAEMRPKLQGMGYRAGVMTQDSFLGLKGTTVHGHEFHYSHVQFKEEMREEHSALQLFKNGQLMRPEGYAQKNIFGSYLHLNFAGHPELLKHWAGWIRSEGDKA